MCAQKQETKLVNVRVAYLRPRYDNLKEFIDDPNNVYIGRKGIVFINGVRYPNEDSIWANPYKITEDSSREEVLEKYRKYIDEKLENSSSLRNKLSKLKGRCLGCWCVPEKCHGLILMEMIDKYCS
jgi:hypothetical protein